MEVKQAMAILAMALASTAWAGEQAAKPEGADSAAAQMTKTLDTDGDGAVSKVEAAADPQLSAVFEKADGNADGKLDAAEIAKLMKK